MTNIEKKTVILNKNINGISEIILNQPQKFYNNDYDNYVEPFIKETGAMRISNYGTWNIDINTRPTDAQITYIADEHVNGESFCYDYMGERSCIDNAIKAKVFNFLKKIQQNWDKDHVV